MTFERADEHSDLHLNNEKTDRPPTSRWHPLRRKSVASLGRKLTPRQHWSVCPHPSAPRSTFA